MTTSPHSHPDQGHFLECYRGRQSALHHAAYMRMSKVLLALQLCEHAGLSLGDKDILDYGFGAGTFFRYCPKNSRLFGVEMDRANVDAVSGMLKERGYPHVDLQTIQIERWNEHPLLAKQYDVILCSHVLEHLPDPVAFLSTIKASLRPGGAFLGLVPINERKMDSHHVQRVDQSKIDDWASATGLHVHLYLEADPWKYWPQPILASGGLANRLLAQAVSLGLGVPATLLGERWWPRLSRYYAALTRSQPTQAAFILKEEPLFLAQSDPAK